MLYFFPTYVKVILGWFPNKENIFKQLQCKDILGMDREIVLVLKELEIWSIIPRTIHICNEFHNFQGTFTFLISTELHNTLKRGKRCSFVIYSDSSLCPAQQNNLVNCINSKQFSKPPTTSSFQTSSVTSLSESTSSGERIFSVNYCSI